MRLAIVVTYRPSELVADEASVPVAEARSAGAARVPGDLPRVPAAVGRHGIRRAGVPQPLVPGRIHPTDPRADGRALALPGRSAARSAASGRPRRGSARRLDARGGPCGHRTRTARIGAQHDPAEAGRARRRCQAAAGGRRRAGRGFRFGDGCPRARGRRAGCRRSAGSAGTRTCPRAVHRRKRPVRIGL